MSHVTPTVSLDRAFVLTTLKATHRHVLHARDGSEHAGQFRGEIVDRATEQQVLGVGYSDTVEDAINAALVDAVAKQKIENVPPSPDSRVTALEAQNKALATQLAELNAKFDRLSDGTPPAPAAPVLDEEDLAPTAPMPPSDPLPAAAAEPTIQAAPETPPAEQSNGVPKSAHTGRFVKQKPLKLQDSPTHS